MILMRDQKCKVDHCDRLVGRKGAKELCSAHYKRFLVGADMTRPFRVNNTGWLSSNGYTYIGKRAIHRLVVEREIGRRLSYNEIVHHRDGDKANNDPSNLQVLDRGEHICLHTLGKTNEQRAAEKAAYGHCLPDRSLKRGGQP